jgi:hypothetical protein
MKKEIIIYFLILAVLSFMIYKNYKKNKLPTSKSLPASYQPQKNNLYPSIVSGTYDIVLAKNNEQMLPYLFQHLSKNHISGNNCKWSIQNLNKNQYKIMIHEKPVCVYLHNDKLCLYELEEQKKDDDCNKPTLCSTDSILNAIPPFNDENSMFEIEQKPNGILIKKDGQYICKQDSQIILTRNLNDNCIWKLI